MGYIIFLFVLWLVMAYFFNNFVVPTIIIGVLLILLIIWLAKTGRIKVKKSNSEQSNDNTNHNHIDANFSITVTTTKRVIADNPPAKIPTRKYDLYYRPKDEYADNMNYKLYQCAATYAATKRKRSLTIEAFNDEEVEKQLDEKGFLKPYDIERIPFLPPTDSQISNIGTVDTSRLCAYDVAALLDKKFEHDSNPNPQLLQYATEMKIKLSYCIGKNALYDLIFSTLELRDKIAFFVFCVYRWGTDDRYGNLNNSSHKDLFYQFSDSHITDDKFIKSLNKYEGKNLKFFGKLTVGDTVVYGGSAQTIAFKTTMDFLKDHFIIKNTTSKTL